MAVRRNPRVNVIKLDAQQSNGKPRPKRWRVYWIDPSGKQRTKHFERKADADRHADRLKADLSRGQYFDPKSGELPFSDVWETYLRGKSATVKGKTLAGYRSLGDSLILPTFQDRRLNSIIKSDVTTWLADIMSGADAVSPSRARQALIAMNAALSSAVDDKLIPENPAANVKNPRKAEKREGKSLTAAQLQALADEMPTQRDRALTLTLGLTGLRFGEASALQVRAIDFDRLNLRVSRTYSEWGGGLTEDVPKNHQSRTVPFPASLADELRPLVDGKLPTADVFTGPKGKPQRSTNWIRRVYRPALRRLTVEDEHGNEQPVFSDVDQRVIHDLRHTFASLAIQAGANIKVLQRAMGHADATETLNTYADFFPDDLAGLGAAIQASAYPVLTKPDSASAVGQQETPGLRAV